MSAIKIKWLTKNYWENKVLKKIDLDIESGDFFALLWQNGAGKTTMISILTNLVKKDGWKIKINGTSIDKDFASARKNIWVVPQEFNFDQFEKVKNIPVIQAGYYGISKKVATERTEKYLKQLWLWEKRENKARELSGWMKRRLMIARALVHEPKILILDEPTAGVDVELRNGMWDFIRELNKSGTTILLTTHYLEEVEALCNRVAIIHKWEIIRDTKTKFLLEELQEESIILNTNEDIPKDIENTLKEFQAEKISKKELSVVLSKKHSLNELFTLLNSLNIEVSSFRNKANRLEQLFIHLTK